jgi:hypothetical protein
MNRRAAPVVLLVWAAFASAGCTLEDLSDASLVQGLRVLGVQANPPEAFPGDSVDLVAWVADPKGGTHALTWSFCTLPSDGIANPGCTDGTGNGLVGIGSGDTITMTVPTLDPSVYGPLDATYGVYLPIVVHAVAPDDKEDVVYRLRVRVAVAPGCNVEPPFSPGCVPNNNPAYAGIEPLLDDSAGATPTPKGRVWAFVAEYTDDSDEMYKIESTSDPTVPEMLRTEWYATAGTFPNQPVGGDAVQKFTVDRALPPTGGIIDMWVVAHDDRGGTGMTHRSFVMQ